MNSMEASGGAGMGAGIFFVIMLGLFVAWIATGGPHNLASTKIFAVPQTYISSANSNLSSNSSDQTSSQNSSGWNVFGSSASESPVNNSPITGEVVIENVSGTSVNATAAEQYVTIYAPSQNSAAVDISALSIKSVLSGAQESLGSGTSLPMAGQVNGTSDILLSPGQTAIVNVGESPIGVSFQENACVGFLSQHQTFTPDLYSDCPKPAASSIPIPPGQDLYACTEYIQSLPSCTTPTYSYNLGNSGVTDACQSYADSELNYNDCVAGDKGAPDFYGSTWRVFLNRTTPLWQEHDTVELLDGNGLVVAHDSY